MQRDMSGVDTTDGSSTWHGSAKDVDAVKASHDSEKLPMQTITIIGLDIAKSFSRFPALMLTARWSVVSQENRLL